MAAADVKAQLSAAKLALKEQRPADAVEICTALLAVTPDSYHACGPVEAAAAAVAVTGVFFC